MLVFVSGNSPFLSIPSYCRELASQSIIVSTIAPNIVATVALVITGERAHSCRGSTGIIDSPNGCIGQEPVLACAKLTGVVDKHVLLGWGNRLWGVGVWCLRLVYTLGSEFGTVELLP